ncbi:molybdopterin-dependent oxidoreductase [soil metagenome]
MSGRIAERVSGSYVGAPVRRVNDPKFVTGRGKFVDDITLPGTLHIGFVRSPHAHARIRSIDSSAAAEVPGVHSIVTGEQLASWMKPDGPHDPLLPGRDLQRYPITPDKARMVGDPVAAVLAETAEIAADAAELVTVDYEVLSGVASAVEAMGADAPIVWDGWENNVAWRWEAGDGDVEAAFDAADHTVELELEYQRVVSMFLETRGVIATWDAGAEELTIWSSTQVPHRVRTYINDLIGVPEHHVRSIAPDVGGGFGSKGGVYPEYLLAALLTYRLGRPVKWIETRSEHFVSTNQGRDQVQRIEAAVSSEGRILGMTVQVISNCGAYGAASVGQRTGMMASGPYDIENMAVEVLGVMTNTTPTSAYRGAGRPEAAYLCERVIDRICIDLGLDPIAVRQLNFVPSDAFPHRSATGVLYDSGDYARALSVATEKIGWDEAIAQQQAAREDGRIVGTGIGVYCEFAGPGWDSGEVRVSPSGNITVMTGISPHGQGNETSLAQIVADQLGVPFENITVKASDTAVVPQGIGTFGSRGTAIGGGAVQLAAGKVAEKVKAFAAAILEVSPDDIELADGEARVRGVPDESVPFVRIARTAHAMDPMPGGLEPGLDAQAFFQPDGRQFPFGVHIAQVEINPDTGETLVTRYLSVDDCGTIINPLLVEGQRIGGLAQGFGQALWEHMLFADDGQVISGSLMDYAAPKASQMPPIELHSTVTPSPFTPHGAKGVGEAGTTGAPPAIVNATIDALKGQGINHVDMPLTAEKIWRLIGE